jgi:hypothetical protein
VAVLDAKDARAVDQAAADLRRSHGDRLRAVVLCGDAASEGYVPGRTPLDLAVVLDGVTAAALRATAAHVAAWRRLRIDVPLLLDPPYIASAVDVFPLEFLDLTDRHRVLHGDDPFAAVAIDVRGLRAEVEAQLRGKLLHLGQAYLDSAAARASLRELLVASAAAFDLIMRGMLRLRDVARPEPARLLAEVERTFGLQLPTLGELAAVRRGERRIVRADLEPLFAAYYDEVRALVGIVDKL